MANKPFLNGTLGYFSTNTPEVLSKNLAPSGPLFKTPISESSTMEDVNLTKIVIEEDPMFEEFKQRLQSDENKLKQVKEQLSLESEQHPKTNNLKELEEMVENLQKENFSLKLKIFYLQEGVNRSKTGSVDEIINESVNVKVLLEQRTKELEERNMLLIKARNAIEILQEQLRNSKKEFDEFAKENSSTLSTLEGQIESTKQQNELMKEKYDKIKLFEKTIDDLKLKLEQRNVLLLHMHKKLEEVIPQERNKGILFTQGEDILDLNQSFNSFQDKIIDRVNQLSRIQKQFVAGIKETEQKFQRIFENLNKQLDERIGQMSKYEARIRALKEEFDNSKIQASTRIQFLETELRNKENIGSNSVSKLQLELEEKKLLITHLESERRKTSETLSKLKQNIQLLEADKLALVEKTLQFETQIASLKQNAPSRELTIELELNQKLVKQLREKIDLYESQYSAQKSDLEDKKGQIAQLHIKMESVIKENIEYKASLNLLQQKLQDAMKMQPDDLEQQILKQVEETQSLMTRTQNALEEEKKKYLQYKRQKEETRQQNSHLRDITNSLPHKMWNAPPSELRNATTSFVDSINKAKIPPVTLPNKS